MRFTVFFDSYYLELNNINPHILVGDLVVSILGKLHIKPDSMVCMVHEKGILGKDVDFNDKVRCLNGSTTLYLVVNHHKNLNTSYLRGPQNTFTSWLYENNLALMDEIEDYECDICDGCNICNECSYMADEEESEELPEREELQERQQSQPSPQQPQQSQNQQSQQSQNDMINEFLQVAINQLGPMGLLGPLGPSPSRTSQNTQNRSQNSNQSPQNSNQSPQNSNQSPQTSQSPQTNRRTIMTPIFASMRYYPNLSGLSSQPIAVSATSTTTSHPPQSSQPSPLQSSLLHSSNTGSIMDSMLTIFDSMSYFSGDNYSYSSFDNFLDLIDNLESIPVTLDPATVDRLPVFKYSELKENLDKLSDPSEKCSVCLEEFQNTDELRVLFCKHFFHKQCIDTWLIDHSTRCPLCRSDTRDYNYSEGSNNGNSSNSSNSNSNSSDSTDVDLDELD